MREERRIDARCRRDRSHRGPVVARPRELRAGSREDLLAAAAVSRTPTGARQVDSLRRHDDRGASTDAGEPGQGEHGESGYRPGREDDRGTADTRAVEVESAPKCAVGLPGGHPWCERAVSVGQELASERSARRDETKKYDDQRRERDAGSSEEPRTGGRGRSDGQRKQTAERG